MENSVGYGIIGCGLIANWHAEAIRQIPNAKAVAVADTLPERAKAFAEKHGLKAYADIAALLADDDVRAVCICTPSGTHAELAMKAMEAGKHVLIEKPEALKVEDCDRLIAIAREKQLTAGVVSQLRFSRDVQIARSLLRENKLGDPVSAELSMRYSRSPEYFSQSPWRGTKALDGGGALMNQGIHGVDIMLWIMGDVSQVHGFTRNVLHKIEVEDTAGAVFTFENGAVGTLVASTASAPGYPRVLTVTGTKGCFTLTENALTQCNVPHIAVSDTYTDAGGFAPENVPIEGHIAQLNNFTQAVLTHTDPAVTLEEGRKAVEFILNVYK